MKYFSLLFIITGLLSCKSDTNSTISKTLPRIKVAKFDSELAYAHVEKQLSFGTRVPGSSNHKATKDWIVETMKSYGWSVEEEHFQAIVYTGEELPGTNIISRYKPKASTRILLAAHYDTRHVADKEKENPGRKGEPIMGADDGASGVAVLMSMAKTIAGSGLEIGVDIVFFDLEDYGEPGVNNNKESWAIGSAHWAQNVDRSYSPKHALLLDMVGAKEATFPRESFSQSINSDLVDQVWKLAQNMGHGNYFINENRGIVIDDHISVHKYSGIKMIDIVNKKVGAFGHYHHTHQDDIEIIDKSTMQAVGQVAMAVIFNTQNGIF